MEKNQINYQLIFRRISLVIYDVASVLAASFLAIVMRYEFEYELIPDYFNDYLEFERVKSEKGLFMNENCAEEVIRQCSDMIADPENSVLIPTFESRIEKVEGLSEAEKGAYIEENYNAVMEYVIPAYENTIDVFEKLKTTGENDLGLSYLENGEEYYRYLLAADVGTDKTPEEVIKMV